jgi:hypothetical protein
MARLILIQRPTGTVSVREGLHSWSKEPSRTIAGALTKWLSELIQALEPWVSNRELQAANGGEARSRWPFKTRISASSVLRRRTSTSRG